ncbi:spermatogenesis-associated protein 2 [Micropterus salmoides]|uniref:spermatogenesis-associated protein 2 n=1 Tax=Micropterus salmoides TaxID=27706 RepID=UPI0018EBE36B|nr:spermatogenesis-associated protein 2 [Micropterus salmoides]
MKDGVGAGQQAEVSRQELFEDYVNCYQLCTEVRPCRDASLLKKAGHYLLREPEPRGTSTVFPVYQVLTEGSRAPSTDYRKLLSAVIKAAELLETLCVNLFLHPWKKEIKAVKTFTGPFVYCLLPVLSSSTIQSVLASIGYLPHAETPQSEYRLSEDANPDRAMLVGFELLLARVECYHLLELLEKDQLGPQEWLEVLQRRAGPTKLEEPTEPKTTIAQKEEEKKGEADRHKAPLSLSRRLGAKPQPKPRHCHRASVDQSIMEMQLTYPDLAFRGRPLLTDKPRRANSSRSSSSKSVHTASTTNYSDDMKAADLPTRDCIKGTKATATSIRSRNDGSKAEEVFGDDGRSSGCNKRNSGGTAISCSFSNSDGSSADDELSGPQAISLHIVLRAGSTAEQGQKPAESQPTAEPPSWIQQQTAAGDPPSLSSMDEEQELRRLEERMGQLRVQETEEEVKRGEENTKKERKVSTEQNLRKPVTETCLALSRRHSRSSQKDPVVIKEQKQPTVGQPSLPTVGSADCQSCKEGGSAGQLEEDTVRREEEQLAQSFVIIDNHKK